MAHILTNRGHFSLCNVAISASTDFRAGVITDAALPADAAIRDYNFVADLLAAATEAARPEYARQDLANVTITEDDANDWTTITSDDATMTAVSAGETWAGIFYYTEAATDATRVLYSVDKVATPVPTNGGDITISGLDYTVGQNTIITG